MRVNRTGEYPFTTPETWRTRGWLLVKKVRRAGSATANDRRVAAMLLKHQLSARSNHALLRSELETIAYG
jgi:hypothetical protein